MLHVISIKSVINASVCVCISYFEYDRSKVLTDDAIFFGGDQSKRYFRKSISRKSVCLFSQKQFAIARVWIPLQVR